MCPTKSFAGLWRTSNKYKLCPTKITQSVPLLFTYEHGGSMKLVGRTRFLKNFFAALSLSLPSLYAASSVCVFCPRPVLSCYLTPSLRRPTQISFWVFVWTVLTLTWFLLSTSWHIDKFSCTFWRGSLRVSHRTLIEKIFVGVVFNFCFFLVSWSKPPKKWSVDPKYKHLVGHQKFWVHDHVFLLFAAREDLTRDDE